MKIALNIQKGFTTLFSSHERGFTLIELLVAIAIIGVVAAGLITVINPVTQFQKAQDSRRKSDLSQIQKSLEQYFQDNARYPVASDFKLTDSDGITANWGTSWAPYMSLLPKDPSSPSKNYVYSVSSDGQIYYLYASLDKTDDSQACNGGAVCASLPSGASCGINCNYEMTNAVPGSPIAGPNPTSTPDSISVKLAALPTGRDQLSCVKSSYNNKIYCFGGFNISGPTYYNSIVEYDPLTGNISVPATLPTGRRGHSCAENSLSRKIYCFGGFNGSELTQILEYNPANPSANAVAVANLPGIPREALSCAENFSTHKIYCFGGVRNGLQFSEILEYNPATPSVNAVVVANLPTVRQGLSCVGNSSNGRIYCSGGNNGNTGNYTEIVEFNPTPPTANVVANLPDPKRYGLSCAENSSTHKIYCFGGNRTDFIGDYTDQIVEFNPNGYSVGIRSAVLPSDREYLSCAEYSPTHRIYCFGGVRYLNFLNEIVEYISP